MDRRSTHRRRAARLARLLRPGAELAGAWTSSEALVRLGPGGAALAPAVVVVEGEPPYDGVVEDRRPLLIIELTPGMDARWASTASTVWAPSGDGGVLVTSAASTRRIAADGVLTVAGHATVTLQARHFLAAVAGDGAEQRPGRRDGRPHRH